MGVELKQHASENTPPLYSRCGLRDCPQGWRARRHSLGQRPVHCLRTDQRSIRQAASCNTRSSAGACQCKELDAILTYHVVSGVAAFSKDLTDGEKIKTVEGQDVTASIYFGNRIFINKALVTTADVSASNGVIHIIDTVLSLPVPEANHLFFYWKNAAYNRCGDVDAAPRMPASLFEPENKAALQAYINVTIALFHITDGNPSDPQKTQLKQGTCKENGCGTLLPGCPSNKPNCDYPNPIMAEWAPKKMMQIICDTACNCNYPSCSDVPDDPKTKHWCSLCGPKFNAPIGITLYNPSDTK